MTNYLDRSIDSVQRHHVVQALRLATKDSEQIIGRDYGTVSDQHWVVGWTFRDATHDVEGEEPKQHIRWMSVWGGVSSIVYPDVESARLALCEVMRDTLGNPPVPHSPASCFVCCFAAAQALRNNVHAMDAGILAHDWSGHEKQRLVKPSPELLADYIKASWGWA